MGCQPWPQSAYGVWWQRGDARREEVNVDLSNVVVRGAARTPVPALAFAAGAGEPARDRAPDYFSPRPEPDEALL